MFNHYPLWKYLVILFVVVMSIIYALPNLYPDDPAVQISGVNAYQTTGQPTLDKANVILEKADIAVKSDEVKDGSVLIRLQNADQQLAARALIKDRLGDNYVVALNLASTTPKWLKSIGAHPMKQGLDLSGGVHFLLEVDTDKAVQARMEVYNTELRTLLRKEKLRYRTLPGGGEFGVRELGFHTKAVRDMAIKVISDAFPDFTVGSSERGGLFLVRCYLNELQIRDIADYAVRQNLVTVRNRVNELGVSEPLVQRQGRHNIVVELPGVQDTAEAKRILGKAANLEFRLAASQDASLATTDSYAFRNGEGSTVRLERDVILTGDQVASARSAFDAQSGGPQVTIDLDSRGGHLINRATRNNVERSMAVLFIEQKPVTRYEMHMVGDKEERVKVNAFREEKSIISLATIQTTLGNSFRITGLNSSAEASELALLLRAGSLAAPMHFVEERTVGPSLGRENILMGINSTIVGFVLVLMFMLVVYRMFGLFANIALSLNLVLLIAAMSLMGATLTMPGIAGIVLTLGMAVDANVLIFSRIREELKNGLGVQKAIYEGYDRAFVSIFDGNITTLLVGIILYAVGTGPIKGFAVTLSLGIVTSMFTAIVGTRALANLVYGRRDLKTLTI